MNPYRISLVSIRKIMLNITRERNSVSGKVIEEEQVGKPKIDGG
jgi:hypothetical protein